MAASDGAGIGANGQGAVQPGHDPKYWAFISYSHADEVWARWLHRTLETYRIPKRLREGKHADVPRRLLPIFRDVDELPGSSNLGARLEEALGSSRALIVICSPHAARSRWVDQEIRTFQAAGGEDRIFAVIVDGEPNASDPSRECFPPGLQKGLAEPLACDPRDGRDGKTNCKLRLVAGMLGLSFDELKRRDRQRRIRRAALVAAASVVLAAVLAASSYYGLNQNRIAESRRNAVKSQEIVAQDPVAALELAIAASRTAPTIEASRALSNALTFQLTRTILNHPAPVADASFSPDARRVLTCTDDGTARVWETESARLVFALKSAKPEDRGRSHACLFSPDGSLILTITARGGARLWNARSGQMTATLAGHTGEILTGSFSRDGARVVTGGQDRTARVWDAKTGRQQIAFAEHDAAVTAAFFFPGDSRVVSIGSEGKAIVWNASTGEAIVRFGETVPFVQDAVLSPDGKRLLISNFQYSAVLWNPDTGEQIRQLTTRSLGAAFTRDSARLITGSGDGRVTVWEAEDGSAVKELFHSGPVESVMFSPDASLVITADDRLHLWYMPELGGGGDQEAFSLRGHNAEAVAADISSDGELLLTFGPGDRTVRVWDIAGGTHVKVFGEPDEGIGDVLFSPDGSKILTSGDLLQIWAAKNARHLSTMKIPAYISTGTQFSKDATRLMASCLKGSLCVFDTASGALLWKADDVHTTESAFSSGGNLVAAAGEDHSLTVFDLVSGTRRVFVGEGESPVSIVFSPDDRQVLASFRGEQYVWDLASGRQVRRLKGYGALFSPDRATIATVQRDVARWYDAAAGRLLHEVKIPANAIETHAFSHDSLLLAAGSTDGLIKVWDVRTGGEVLSLKPEDGRVRVLRFSADGKDLIAVTDGAIHVYSIANGNEWQTFHNNFGLTDVAVSPDGSSIVAVDTRRRALLYSLKFADLLDAAERRRPAVGSAAP